MGGGGGRKNENLCPCLYQTQPEVYGKVMWMGTSKRVNLFSLSASREMPLAKLQIRVKKELGVQLKLLSPK